MTTTPPPLGCWARAEGFLGLVAGADSDTVTLVDPGRRAQHTAAVDRVEVVPAAAVRVTVSVELPLPHGLDEEALRRWTALLADPVLRERAARALADAGLDTGAAEPPLTLEVHALSDGHARCLCGARVVAAPGQTVDCTVCRRRAAPPVAPPPFD